MHYACMLPNYRTVMIKNGRKAKKNGITEYTPDLVRDDITDDKHDRNMKGTFHHQQSTVL